MSNSIFGIGLSGLAAAQAGLLTSGHNISNVNTPGYNRQEAIQLARFPQFLGSGFFGRGVDVVTVRRVYSDFLAAQMLSTQSQASELASYQAKLGDIDNLFGTSKTGLAPALQQFFGGVNEVAAHPASIPSRQTMLSSGNALASRFRQLDSQLTGLRTGANSEIKSTVSEINSYLDQIAGLNQKIIEISTAIGGSSPNDLLDQRDLLVSKLNTLVDARVVTQSDGSYSVFLSGGQALVLGKEVSHLSALPSTTDPRDLVIGVQIGTSVVVLPPSQISGGSLGAVLKYRDSELARSQNELGRIALVLADRFNAQHRLGQDLAGNPGQDFFTPPAPQVQVATTNTGTGAIAATVFNTQAVAASDYKVQYVGPGNWTVTRLSDGQAWSYAGMPQNVDGLTLSPSGTPQPGDSFLVQPTRYAARDFGVALTNPALIAAAAPIVTGAGLANTGTGTISPGSIDASYWSSVLAASGATLTFSSGALSGFPAGQAVTVTNGASVVTYPAPVASIPYTPGATISFGGMSFTISGQPANGDTFTLRPNAGGVSDGRNAQRLASLADATLVGGTTTFEGALGELVAYIGNAAQAAKIESAAQEALLAQQKLAQQAMSGVNLDEEAANLQRYQQAYQAAAKMMTVAATLFDTILQIKS